MLRLQILRSRGQLKFFSDNRVRRATSSSSDLTADEHYLDSLIATVRTKSFRLAQCDPLGLAKCEKEGSIELIEASRQLLLIDDIARPLKSGVHTLSSGSALLDRLRPVYQQYTGYEFDRLTENERTWLAEKIESMHDVQASPARQKHIARLLVESEAWDKFMAKRFGQVKRYGLEGAESMIVAIDTLFQLGSGSVKHSVIAMPHRGRLNLMIGLLGYPAEAIFHKLQGNSELAFEGSADVLSHLSLQDEVRPGIKATLLPNSSHLESINPIAQGFAYGLLRELESSELLPIQIHGDAAFNGQGVTMETVQMAKLEGFSVGGTIHLTVNNQLGFTTPSARGRSCPEATDLAHLINAPVFHVNMDRPEEVARCTALAFAYRQQFGKDVFIDMVGYRRHGHNELDEPAFTQPTMYRAVKSIPTAPKSYSASLISAGILKSDELVEWEEAYDQRLEAALKRAPEHRPTISGIQPKQAYPEFGRPTESLLKEAALASVNIPEGFNVHPRLAKFHIESRKTMIKEGHVDWAAAEAMAVGSLLHSGVSVRLCGQDVGRGTFSHRHWQIYDQQTDQVASPLASMARNGAKLDVVNSHLSEFAVAGFEYGASIENPAKLLPIWEAQFGDFFNGAQIIWDAYLSAGKEKWGLDSGLVVLLPHGFDGAGPEHSSARIERWLQMCNEPIQERIEPAKLNMAVVNPTTASNYFHLLRRQITQPFRKPLIVASPKTLLRLPAASSSLKDLTDGDFKPVIYDSSMNTEAVKKVVLVSGKFYYDLVKERQEKKKAEEVAIVRIEELCPFPESAIKDCRKTYPSAAQWIWCQEEPENMGAYTWIAPRISKILKTDLGYVGRPAAAAPAAGYSKLHKQQLQTIFSNLFA